MRSLVRSFRFSMRPTSRARSAPAAPFLGALLFAALATSGCGQFFETETITLEIFPVEVKVAGPAGTHLAGIPVTFSHSDRLTTNGQGRLRVNYQGAAGGKLHIAVELPEGLVAQGPSEKEFVLGHDANGNPAAVRFVVPVTTQGAAPETSIDGQVKYVVVVDSDCEGQEVEVDGDPLGTTDEDGYLEKHFMRAPGGFARIVARAKGPCDQLVCGFALPSEGAILNVEPGCAGADPDTAGALAGAPPPVPAELDLSEEKEPPPPPPAPRRRRRPRPAPRERVVIQPEPLQPSDDEVSDRPLPGFDEEEGDAAPEPPPPTRVARIDRRPAASTERERAVVMPPSLGDPPPADLSASLAAAADSTDAPLPRDDDDFGDDFGDDFATDDPSDAVEAPVESAPPPDQPIRPANGRAATVSCEPPGLDLYVDGQLALRACGPKSTAYLAPGVRKLTLSGPECAETLPTFVEVPARGRIKPIKAAGACRSNCIDQVRSQAQSGRKLSESDLGCLKGVSASAAHYLEAKLLLAHVYTAQSQIRQAERVLSQALETRRGRSDPELRVRLAELLGRRKQLTEASQQAEAAWRYRMKFRGSRPQREKWILNTLKLRAGFFEQLFYAEEELGYFQKAMAIYTDLERTAEQSKNAEMMTYARDSRDRVQRQRQRLDGE